MHVCVWQIIDNTVIQLQNLISKMQSANTSLPDETQEMISRAQNLIHDVSAARQVKMI